MYKIEKGIPIPEKRSCSKKTFYPLDEMTEIMDSFFIEMDDLSVKQRSKLSSYLSLYSKKNEKSFVTREVEEKGKKGIRVWRIV